MIKSRTLAAVLCLLAGIGMVLLINRREYTQQIRTQNTLHIPDSIKLHDADIICRLGRAWYSTTFKDLGSKSKLYSHAGLIVHTSRGVMVYHTEDFSPANHKGVCLEPLDSFVEQSAAVGIYRIENLSTEAGKKILQFTRRAYQRCIPFDYDFDYQSNDKLYCTEFVVKALMATPEISTITPSLVMGRKAYTIDHILSVPHLTLLWYGSTNKKDQIP